MTLRLANDPSEIGRIGPFVEAFRDAHGLDSRQSHHLTLVLEELATNVIAHGFSARAGDDDVTIVLALRGGDIEVRYEDSGRAFDIMSAPPPELGPDVEARAVGGLGIHLVRRLMDTVDYERTGSRNRIRMTVRRRERDGG